MAEKIDRVLTARARLTAAQRTGDIKKVEAAAEELKKATEAAAKRRQQPPDEDHQWKEGKIRIPKNG